MAQKDDSALLAQKEIIKAENSNGANTKTRIGQMFEDIIDSKMNNDDMIDEDDMASDSASKVPTQQSVKAYVDATVVGGSVDATPTNGSTNAVQSNGVFDALALKAPLHSPAFTGTATGLTKGMVGLLNVDNTSDADKPVSTDQQTALDLKANLASPTFTGTPAAPTAAAATDNTQVATTAFVHDVLADNPIYFSTHFSGDGTEGDPISVVVDTTPTDGSANPVTSNAVFDERSSTTTLSNKRLTARVGSTTSSATPTINTDNVDFYHLTAQAENITSFTTNLTGTPNSDDILHIAITGTGARTITWGASFEASTIALPTTTVSTDRLDVVFSWNAVTSKWRCGGVW